MILTHFLSLPWTAGAKVCMKVSREVTHVIHAGSSSDKELQSARKNGSIKLVHPLWAVSGCAPFRHTCRISLNCFDNNRRLLIFHSSSRWRLASG